MYTKGKSSTSKAFASKTTKCTFCKKPSHTTNRCFRHLEQLDEEEANLTQADSDQDDNEKPSDNALTIMADLSLEEDYDDWAF